MKGGQLDELRKPYLRSPDKSLAFIHWFKRTVATLLTAWENTSNAFC